MTVLSVFAYGFIAYGPTVVLFAVTVARHAYQVILLMTGAFFWLLSLFLSSIIWTAVPPLRDTLAFTVPFSVILQELFRFLYFLLLRRADKVLEIVSEDPTALRKHKIAYVAGMGFGVIAGVVAFANVLKLSGGPAVVGVNDGGSQFFVLSSAFGANVLVILHICWGVLMFSGLHACYDKSGVLEGVFKIILTFSTHLLLSLLSLLSQEHSTAYFLVAAHVVALGLAVYSVYTVGARPSTLRHFFKK
jgi:anterior pharynx defective protein 1